MRTNTADNNDHKRDVDAEHDESLSDVSAALAVGAKGHTKSADVAMKLFENHDINMYIDPVEEKRIIRKVDWIIIPMIAVNCESQHSPALILLFRY